MQQIAVQVLCGNHPSERLLLRGETVIGRAPGCQVQIASTQVSRRHCRITWSAGVPWIEDLGSSNGTFVEGTRLTPHVPVRLEDKARVQLGPVTLVVEGVGLQTRRPGQPPLVGTVASAEHPQVVNPVCAQALEAEAAQRPTQTEGASDSIWDEPAGTATEAAASETALHPTERLATSDLEGTRQAAVAAPGTTIPAETRSWWRRWWNWTRP